jgi:hypothetical protein
MDARARTVEVCLCKAGPQKRGANTIDISEKLDNRKSVVAALNADIFVDANRPVGNIYGKDITFFFS